MQHRLWQALIRQANRSVHDRSPAQIPQTRKGLADARQPERTLAHRGRNHRVQRLAHVHTLKGNAQRHTIPVKAQPTRVAIEQATNHHTRLIPRATKAPRLIP